MPSPVRPPRLRPGDAVALLSPASPPKGARSVQPGVACLRQMGFNVHLGRFAQARDGYLAGTDAQRAADLRAAFLDPDIKAVFFTRGGYGVSRLLERFDVSLARQYPKIIVGFSDITTLHLALARAGLVSFWGPMPCTSFGVNPFSRRWLRRALMNAKPMGIVPSGRARTLRRGRARGRLTGGTLTLVAASLGTPYEIETSGRIVFLEDAGEEPYKVDRMLTQLLAAGKLSDAAGLVLGVFTDSQPKNYSSRNSWRLGDVLADRLLPLKIPLIAGLAVGHVPNQLTLPYGVLACLDAGARRLTILESAVR